MKYFSRATRINQKAFCTNDHHVKKLALIKGPDIPDCPASKFKMSCDKKVSTLTMKLKVVLELVPGVLTNFDRELSYLVHQFNEQINCKKYHCILSGKRQKKVCYRSTQILLNT